MNWLLQMHAAQPVAHAIGVLALVCVAGMAVGSLKVRSKLTLIVSDDKNPKVGLKPGMKLEIVSVRLAEPTLKSTKVAARLCGGTSTCVALVETEAPQN